MSVSQNGICYNWQCEEHEFLKFLTQHLTGTLAMQAVLEIVSACNYMDTCNQNVIGKLNRDVYPIATYSYLSQLVIVFLVTDFLRYKPLIIASGIVGIIIWSMLTWTISLEALLVVEFFYGVYMATEVAYYTYIYAKVEKKYYSRVSSHTRATMLIGKLVASVMAQLLIYYSLMDYFSLNYITLASQCLATIWAFCLPRAKQSVYFHRYDKDLDMNTIDESKSKGLTLIWKQLINSYKNKKVLQWSIWYALGLCGMYQVYTYIQILWEFIEPRPDVAWNGAVDGIQTFFGAIFAIGAGYIHTEQITSRKTLLMLGVLSIIEGGAILLSCWTYNVYISYIGFTIFGALYAFTITVASAEIAKYLDDDSFGLIFGINTFLSLLLQSCMNVVFVTGSIFVLNIVEQYLVYGFYFIVIGFIYMIFVVIDYYCNYERVQTDDY